MILIDDQETQRSIQALAERRGIGPKEAVRVAVLEANERDSVATADFAARIKPVQDQIRKRMLLFGKGSDMPLDDKAFMDEMWGEQ